MGSGSAALTGLPALRPVGAAETAAAVRAERAMPRAFALAIDVPFLLPVALITVAIQGRIRKGELTAADKA